MSRKIQSTANITNLISTFDKCLPANRKAPVCRICGSPRKKVVLNVLGNETTVYAACDCEIQAYEKGQKEIEFQKKQKEIDKLFSQSQLGKRFQECCFDSFKPLPGTIEVLEAAKIYAAEFRKFRAAGRGMLLSSPPGTGKTHLVAAILKSVVEQLYTACFVVVPELLMKLSNAKSGSLSEYLSGLGSCDLLILDDLGAEKGQPWNTEKIFTIIDTRYRKQLPTLITTNLSGSDLMEHVTPRVFSRLLEMSKTMNLNDAKDYRLRNLNF